MSFLMALFDSGEMKPGHAYEPMFREQHEAFVEEVRQIGMTISEFVAAQLIKTDD